MADGTLATTFDVLPMAALREPRTNPRKHFDAKALAELTESTRAKGLLTPLLVRPLGKEQNGHVTVPAHYEIVAGHRRYRAAKAAGLAEVLAQVRPLTDQEVLEIQVIENLQREDVHP